MVRHFHVRHFQSTRSCQLWAIAHGQSRKVRQKKLNIINDYKSPRHRWYYYSKYLRKIDEYFVEVRDTQFLRRANTAAKVQANGTRGRYRVGAVSNVCATRDEMTME